MKKLVLAVSIALAIPTGMAAALADSSPSKQANEEAKSFHQYLDELAAININSDPELRSILGFSDDGIGDLSDQMTDVSLERRAELRAEIDQILEAVNSFDREALEGQERWSHDLSTWLYNVQADMLAFEWAPSWMQLGTSVYAVDQLFSIPVSIPQFMQNHHAVRNEVDAENYIARLEAIGHKIDQVSDNFEMQQEQGVIPPKVALEGAAGQISTLIEAEPEHNFFVEALRVKLESLADLDNDRQQELLAQASEAVQTHTNPAYQRLMMRLEQTLKEDPPNQGVWALPDGEAFYNAALRWNTSTSLTADEIHQTGIEEVARVEQLMDDLLKEQGLEDGTVGERVTQFAKDPRFAYEDSEAGRAEVIADVEAALERLDRHIPRYFNRVPEQPLEVQPVPAHTEATAPGGYYFPPALDGSRPGTFFINLGDIESHTRWSLPTLAYHEGAPGHHFQISLAQTLDDLPFLRRMLNPSPYTEGWALYAEQLVAEMGIYDNDPLGDLGRLQAEMFRSVRLVVDTGLHYKRWTPEQAEAYMIEKTGMNQRDVRAEINRYLVQPGQATSYKIGHLKMLALREDAKARLGEHFNIGQFHDVVLSNGALPLLVLEQLVEEWVAEVEADSVES